MKKFSKIEIGLVLSIFIVVLVGIFGLGSDENQYNREESVITAPVQIEPVVEDTDTSLNSDGGIVVVFQMNPKFAGLDEGEPESVLDSY